MQQMQIAIDFNNRAPSLRKSIREAVEDMFFFRHNRYTTGWSYAWFDLSRAEELYSLTGDRWEYLRLTRLRARYEQLERFDIARERAAAPASNTQAA